MRISPSLFAWIGLLALACDSEPLRSAQISLPTTRRISRQTLEDKIYGGWAAQMIGVSYGAATEFKFLGTLNEGTLPWQPDQVENALHQDDLYVDMTFVEVIDRLGLDATMADYGDALKRSQYQLWHANAAARRLINIGVPPPLSGDPRYNVHANDIDFQIEADFIGLMSPGLPAAANRYCERIGGVMSYGDGLYGGMFVAGMYAAAFFESDIEKVIQAGLQSIPAASGYAAAVRSAINLWRSYPNDWRHAWTLLNGEWDGHDQCPEGALRAFNIDARLNGAYVTLGLLYGKGDFAQTIEIATRLGQDSDCNAASVAGVLGVILGYANIPDIYKTGIPSLADKKFDYSGYSLNEISRASVRHALEMVVRSGGSIVGDDVQVPMESAAAPPLEQWQMGAPLERFRLDNDLSTWQLGGLWTDGVTLDDELFGVKHHKVSHAAGNTATLIFSGTAVAVAGLNGPDGGRADVFLDGHPAGMVDAYAPERSADMGLWHIYNLTDSEHEIRLVTRADADPRSSANEIRITLAISYRAPQARSSIRTPRER